MTRNCAQKLCPETSLEIEVGNWPRNWPGNYGQQLGLKLALKLCTEIVPRNYAPKLQVSRVPRLIPSLGRLAASLARAVRSVSTESSLLSESCIPCLRNAYFLTVRQAACAGLRRERPGVTTGVDGGG